MRGLLDRILGGLREHARGFSYLHLPCRASSARAPPKPTCFHNRQYLCSIANAAILDRGRDGSLCQMRLRWSCRHWHSQWRSTSRGFGWFHWLLIGTSFLPCVFKWVAMRWRLADAAYSSWKDYQSARSLYEVWGSHDCLEPWSGCSHWYLSGIKLSVQTYLTRALFYQSWWLLIIVR